MTTHDKLAYKNGIIQLIRAKTLALASGNCHSPLPSSKLPYRIETSNILMKTEEAKAWLKRQLRAI